MKWRIYTPRSVRAWNIEALARGTPDAVNDAADRQTLASILAACEAAGRTRENWGPVTPTVGDFAMLDGRWHRIEAVAPGGRSRRPKFELQDVLLPDMPRHRVAWSDIERVARITQDPSAKVG